MKEKERGVFLYTSCYLGINRFEFWNKLIEKIVQCKNKSVFAFLLRVFTYEI